MTWKHVPFCEIVESRGSGAAGLAQSEWKKGGRFPVIGQGAGVIEGWTDRVDLLIRPDPAVVLYGGHTRRAKYVDQAFVPGPNVKILTPADGLDAKFLFRFLEQLPIESRGYADHFPEVRRCSLPLPSLDEQRRITAIVDKADALRAKRREAIAKLDQMLQSVFLDMFGDPVTNPKAWQVVKSGKIFSEKPRIGTTRPATGSGCVIVRVGEIGSYDIAFDRCSRVELDRSEIERYSLQIGDTVLARAIGSKEQLGKCSYFAGSHETVCIDSHVMRLRPDPGKIDPIWFNFLLMTPAGKRLLQSKGGATAVQFNINAQQASDIDVPLPPLNTQREFARICARVRSQRRVSIDAATNLDSLFFALQHRAFSGTL